MFKTLPSVGYGNSSIKTTNNTNTSAAPSSIASMSLSNTCHPSHPPHANVIKRAGLGNAMKTSPARGEGLLLLEGQSEEPCGWVIGTNGADL
jgi:hypothetical protein